MTIARGVSRTQSRGFASLGLILLLVLGLAVFGGVGWWLNKHVPATLNQAPSETESTAGNTTDIPRPAMLSTTTPSGVPVTLMIERCRSNDMSCFGSGRANPETRGAVTVYDLVSKDCAPSWGIIRNEQGVEFYYDAISHLGAACTDVGVYAQIRSLITGNAMWPGV